VHALVLLVALGLAAVARADETDQPPSFPER
jgi:hypothetical protein